TVLPQLLTEATLSSLLLDGESVYSLVVNPFLLLLARVILTKCSAKMERLQLLPWWTLRYINLHQQILEARSPQLLSLCCVEKHVLKCQSTLSDQRSLAIQFHLECAYISLNYYEYGSAKEHINTAKELSGLHINMTGALGKRTRFQEKFLAQLLLEVKRQEGEEEADQRVSETSPTPTPQASLPKDYHLDDDTLLDRITLAEPDLYQLPDLSAEEQALVLGVWKSTPINRLADKSVHP
uniref:Tetratricopeptide repeat protein 27-like n=1 Tax=Poecilia reticulata TaxID=8081 RepID=A0A3P9PF97_POERE